LTGRFSAQAESEIAAALEESARRPLELAEARLVERDSLPAGRWPAELLEGEIVELDHDDPLSKLLPLAHAEVLVPIVSDGRVNHVLRRLHPHWRMFNILGA
jgi:hypothetical protein